MIVSRITLLGVVIDPFSIDHLNQCIATAIKQQKRWIIANHNLHSIYLYHRDQKMRQFYKKAHVIHIDGMPLIYWGRILGYKLKREQRVTYVDWIHPLMAMAAAEGWRVFYLGSKPGVAALAAKRLRQRYPALQITTRDGYFQADDNTAVLAEIANFRPHVLMVGMGMPRQERWILENLEHLSANAILTAGACFDYVAGVIPTPPRWMGRTGLEWLYRLYSEPRRLARRYLLEPWALLPLMAHDLWQMVWRGRNFDTQ
ncbi:WecB/TagA/CpsF family glycosyltransferase [Chloroflexus sp.]|uniref:WecB/TagA/CpsF family glycosyltransferase n=1 Tax=Chloroflexus sp. TaxID=1904827 RepID=UPI002ACE04E2|nr:WecB/TagA/CpsF family glycosyltransferase [Chloroflexus sp.]